MNYKRLLVFLITITASPSMGQDPPLVNRSITGIVGGIELASLLKHARPGESDDLGSRVNQLEDEFREKIEEIKTQTSKDIKDQNEKITKVMGWEHKLAHLLNQSMEVMRELKTQNKDQTRRIDQLEQKLTMLQQNTSPSQPLTRTTKGKMGRPSKVSSPPSSCQELSMLDYYLDGLYLVKNKETNKIETVFCQFLADNQVYQKVIGNVDVKTKNVHFYVQRRSTFDTARAVIPFQVERLNVGDAMDLKAGVFTAPVAGIYHFEFIGMKKSELYDMLDIYLQVNGQNIGLAHAHNLMFGPGMRIDQIAALSASLRLKAGDEVRMFNNRNSVLYDGDYHHTHFTGWLVEEDLSID